MADTDVRVPAGWYPDPLGLPQLRWWDNHAWTEHTSDARQPVLAETAAAGATASAASRPRFAFSEHLAYADDIDPDDLAFVDTAATAATDLPTRRELRDQHRYVLDEEGRDEGGRDEHDATAGDRGAGKDALAYAEPLTALEAPNRDDGSSSELSPAARYARGAHLDDAPRSLRYDLDERHEDLLGETAVPRSAFAHASSSTTTFIPESREPEPAAAPATDAADALAARRATLSPAAVANTVPGWVLTLIPVYVLLMAMLVLLSGPGAAAAPVIVALVLGVPWVAGIVLAVLDVRALRRNGMSHPAHGLWALAGAPVYLVARLVRTVREAGTGFGPVLTYLVLLLFTAGAIVAVPGLAMELSPATFAAEAEHSVQQDAASLGADLTVDCPDTPPLLVQQSFTCVATNASGDRFDVIVSLQRSNGWIDWRVDDWGVFSLGS